MNKMESPFGIISLIFGIIALLYSWFTYMNIFLSIVCFLLAIHAIIFGIIGIKLDENVAMAVIGLNLGIIYFILVIIF